MCSGPRALLLLLLLCGPFCLRVSDVDEYTVTLEMKLNEWSQADGSLYLCQHLCDVWTELSAVDKEAHC